MVAFLLRFSTADHPCQQSMSVACPHCQTLIETPSTDEVVCASCGASFKVGEGTTLGWSSAGSLRKVGKFEVIALAGAGACGTVYKARDTELGRIVALKLAKADGPGTSTGAANRFLREA